MEFSIQFKIKLEMTSSDENRNDFWKQDMVGGRNGLKMRIEFQRTD